MLRICLALMMIFMVRQPVLAQSATQMSEDLSQASLIQEQAAICAAFARVMEYSGLLEETRGKLWRERRFYAGAILRQSYRQSAQEPSNGVIDGIINQYSGWMINLSLSRQPYPRKPISKNVTSSRITSARSAHRYLPMLTKPSPVSARNCLMSRPSSKQRLDKMLKQSISGRVFRTILRSTITLNVNTPGITPETAPELPALSAPEVSSGDNVQIADGKDTSAFFQQQAMMKISPR